MSSAGFSSLDQLTSLFKYLYISDYDHVLLALHPLLCHQRVGCELSQIARFMGPTWGPPGPCRPQMGPMLAPWTLLSGLLWLRVFLTSIWMRLKNMAIVQLWVPWSLVVNRHWYTSSTCLHKRYTMMPMQTNTKRQHYSDVTWTSWRFKSPEFPLYIPLFIRQIKDNAKAQSHGPLWGESTGDRWIP